MSTTTVAYAALDVLLDARLRGCLLLTPEGRQLLQAISQHATMPSTGPDRPDAPMSDGRRRQLLEMTGPGRVALAAERTGAGTR